MADQSSGYVHGPQSLTEKLPECSVSVGFFGRNSKTTLSLKHLSHNPGVLQQLLHKPQCLGVEEEWTRMRGAGKDRRMQVKRYRTYTTGELVDCSIFGKVG